MKERSQVKGASGCTTQLLSRFVNCTGGSRGERLVSYISPRLLVFLRAAEICRAFSTRTDNPRRTSMPVEDIAILPYSGNNAQVLKMAGYIEKYLARDVVGAFVHGSLGTGEEMPYSDFDALVIVRDEVLRDEKRLRRTGLRLFEATSIMYEFDPLQHHGWFALAERELERYPEHYLPAVVLSSAKSLLRGKEGRLQIRRVWDTARVRAAFGELARGVGEQVKKQGFPRNAYQLKVLLSRFMLLPSLYVACRDGKALCKKESFEAARGDFSREQWKVMDEVSCIRAAWEVAIADEYRRRVSRPSTLGRMRARRCAPPVPAALGERLNEDFYGRVKTLTEAMDDALSRHRVLHQRPG
jgi:predicted nucleotidyltransferase